MLALIAGTGALPAAIASGLDDPYLVCALAGFEPQLPIDISFRIEHLGSFLDVLSERGVTQICMLGAIKRPSVDPTALDAATLPLVPRIQKAMSSGDDGALREIIALFEDRGFAIRAAHDLAPDLLPESGILTVTGPGKMHEADAICGDATIAAMGRADTGQACVIDGGTVVARELQDGTDAMLHRIAKSTPLEDPFGAISDVVSDAIDVAADWLTGPAGTPVTKTAPILFKAPKPTQDRRADLPVIGPETATAAASAGLKGIIIETGGVMVLDLPEVISILNGHGMFLWVRPRGTP